MYKVFVNNKPLILTADSLQYRITDAGTLYMSFASSSEMSVPLEVLDKTSEIRSAVAYGSDEKAMWEKFRSGFVMVDAAGGVVENDSRELLFIFRNGKWDLPKGKVEEGEDTRHAAVREVQEECGIKDAEIIRELPCTYHTYYEREKHILKRTRWFFMKASQSHLTPQKEEGITDARWFSPDHLDSVFANTYGSIGEVLRDLLMEPGSDGPVSSQK